MLFELALSLCVERGRTLVKAHHAHGAIVDAEVIVTLELR
jgi:hypothetical protein